MTDHVARKVDYRRFSAGIGDLSFPILTSAFIRYGCIILQTKLWKETLSILQLTVPYLR